MTEPTTTLRVWDTEKKEAVTLPADVARDGVLAGRFVGVKGANYALADGAELKYVKPEDLRNALTRYRVAPESQYREDAPKPETSTLDAARVGGARGLMGTVGLSFDRVVRDAAKPIDSFVSTPSPYRAPEVSSTAERAMGLLEAHREQHGFASGAGEMGGYMLGAALSGGGVAGAVGRAGTAAGLGKAAATMAGGAAEGVVMAEADLDGELARAGDEYTGQAFMAHNGFSHLLMGAGVGAGAALGGHALELGAGALRRGVARMAGRGAEAVAEGAGALGSMVSGAGTTAGVDAGEVAAARAAATGANPRIRLAPGEDVFKVAMENSERGFLAAGGKESYGNIHRSITNEVADGLTGVINHSPEVMRETFGALKGTHIDYLAPAGLRPEVEAAARQAIEDTAAPMRAAVTRHEEAAAALQEAREAARSLRAAESKNAAELARAEKDMAATVAAVERRVTKTRERADLLKGLYEVEAAGSGKGSGKAFDAWNKAEYVAKQASAGASVELRAAEAKLGNVREMFTGVSAEERALKMAAIKDAEAAVEASAHPMLQDYRHTLNLVDRELLAPAATNADWYKRLDVLKKWQYASAESAEGLFVKAEGQYAKDMAQAAKETHLKAGQAITQQLEDGALFGEAAEFTRKFNAARSTQIAAERNSIRGFADKLEVGTKKERMVVNPDKLRGGRLRPGEAVHDRLDSKESLLRSELKTYLDATAEAHTLVESKMRLTPEQRAKSVAVREQIARVQQGLADSAEHASQLAELEAGGAFKTAGGGRTLPLIGGTIAGLPGVVAGAALGAVVTRGQRVAHKAMLQRAAAEIERVTGVTVTNFFKGKPIGGAATPASTSFLKGVGGSKATFERSVEAIKAAVADPAKLGRTVTAALGGLGDTAPGVAMQVTQAMMRGVSYLADHIPDGMKADLEVAAPWEEAPVYSQSEMYAWARRAAAVNDPMTMLRHMQDGTVSDEEVDAVRAVYPDLYEKIGQAIMMEMARAKKPLPRQQRLALSIVYGMPADRSMTPEVLGYLQMVPAGRAGSRSSGPLKVPMLKISNTRSQYARTETQKER